MAKSKLKVPPKAVTKSTKIYFRNLDSIRFFAALMVFLEHVKNGIFWSLKIQLHGWGKFIWNICDGGIGVSIFFVLSGFLITYLILSEIKLTGDFSLKKFYIRRVLRIWPLYFMVVAIVFLLFPVLEPMMKIHINHVANPLYQWTFLSNFNIMGIEQHCRDSEEMMQNITWSVAIEEQFYAFWPLLFFLLPRKFFLPAIVTVAAGSLIFRLAHQNDFFVLYFHTLAVMIDLATGALFAYFIITNEKVKTFFQQTGTLTILVSFILFFLSMMYHDEIFTSPAGKFLERPYFAVLFGFIIASQAMIIRPSPLELGKISLARKLGKYTYGMYLLHPIALEIIYSIYNLSDIQRNTFSAIFSSALLGLALTIFLAWFSYEYFEKRFLTLKNSFAVIKEK